MIADGLHRNFARQTMMQTLGAELVSVGDGHARIEAPILSGARQQQGFAHAGLTFAVGDSAAGYAALSVMDDGHDVLTTEMKINLLRPAAGDRLIATGEVVKPVRRITVVRATVHVLVAEDTKLVAILQGSMLPVAPD